MSPMFQVEYPNTLGPTGDNNFKKREKKVYHHLRFVIKFYS